MDTLKALSILGPGPGATKDEVRKARKKDPDDTITA